MNVSPEKIQEYIDKLEIQETIARYSICADTGDADGFASVFTEDGLWEWKAAGLHFCGRSQLRRVGEAVFTHAKGAQHAISNPVIRVNGNHAKSICQLTVSLSKPEQIYSLMLGYYEDELVKADDNWLISRRMVRVENLEILAQGKIAEYFAPVGVALAEIMQANN